MTPLDPGTTWRGNIFGRDSQKQLDYMIVDKGPQGRVDGGYTKSSWSWTGRPPSAGDQDPARRRHVERRGNLKERRGTARTSGRTTSTSCPRGNQGRTRKAHAHAHALRHIVLVACYMPRKECTPPTHEDKHPS